MKIAVCPGSFDPLTLGHLSIIRRASELFDKVVVLIMTNSGKTPFFSVDDCLSFIKRCVSDIKNVTVDSASGLLADCLKKIGGCAIVKGVRAFSDFEYEFQMALANKKINPQIETIFLATDSEQCYLSSTLVKEIASLGGDITGLVPKQILEDVTNAFRRNIYDR